MPFFFAGRVDGDRVEILGVDARHLAGPLRARVGERIRVVDPAGFLLTVELATVGPELVAGSVVERRPHHPEPGSKLTLAIAMLPAAALEHVLTRCTELGAHAFVLVQADRSVARGAKPERWAAICREAAMLAGRSAVPEVTGPRPLAAVVAAASTVLLDSRAETRLAEVLDTELTLAIGPEGGWTPRELALAGRRATMGPRTLRADTAAVAALAIALSARGDL